MPRHRETATKTAVFLLLCTVLCLSRNAAHMAGQYGTTSVINRANQGISTREHLTIWLSDSDHLTIWSADSLTIWVSNHLTVGPSWISWQSDYMTVGSSNHPSVWPSDHLPLSDYLTIQPSDLPTIWLLCRSWINELFAGGHSHSHTDLSSRSCATVNLCRPILETFPIYHRLSFSSKWTGESYWTVQWGQSIRLSSLFC